MGPAAPPRLTSASDCRKMIAPVPRAGAIVRKACSSCKIDLDPQYLFCPECGSTLDNVPDPAPGADSAPLDVAPSTLDASGAPSSMRPRPGPASSVQARSGGGRFRIVRLARGGGSATPFDIPDAGLALGHDSASTMSMLGLIAPGLVRKTVPIVADK